MPSRAARIYVTALAAVALAIVAICVVEVANLLTLAAFAVLILLVQPWRSQLGGDVTVSLPAVVAMATYPVLGAWGAPALLAGAFGRRQSSLGPVRRIYNLAQNVTCTFVGGLVYVGLGGAVGSIDTAAFPRVLVAFTAANIVFHFANMILLAGVLRLDSGVSMLRVLRGILSESAIPVLGYGYLGLVMAVLWVGRLGPAAAVLMLVPLLVARWALDQWTAEKKAHQQTMRALAQAIETKDHYTRGHGERVSKAARMLGSELGWEADRLNALAEAGLLHDVGKIGVSTRVLQKDGRLTEEEYESIKAHPLHGVALVGQIAFLEDARAGIMHHHERYDGGGYPSGLKGEDIPIFARVLGIADAFDCMTSLRSYRPARPVDEAIEELIRCRGGHFDPDLVDRFVAVVHREGWEPAVGKPEPVAGSVRGAAFDHDDPTRPPQIAGGDDDLEEIT